MDSTFIRLPYFVVTKQIRESGDLLRLPYQAIASALVFLHRFMQGSDEPYVETVEVHATAQASVRTNDLLNAVHLTAVTPTVTNAAEGHEPAASAPGFSPLVGQPYYSLKQSLILDEQHLLRTINFDIVVEHPYKYLLNFAKTIDARHGLVQLSVSLLNDSIVYSNLCLSHSPADIAAACLQLSGAILGSSVNMPSLEPRYAPAFDHVGGLEDRTLSWILGPEMVGSTILVVEKCYSRQPRHISASMKLPTRVLSYEPSLASWVAACAEAEASHLMHILRRLVRAEWSFPLTVCHMLLYRAPLGFACFCVCRSNTRQVLL